MKRLCDAEGEKNEWDTSRVCAMDRHAGLLDGSWYRCAVVKQAIPHPPLGVALVPFVLSVSVSCDMVVAVAFGLFLLCARLFVSLNVLFPLLFPTEA